MLYKKASARRRTYHLARSVVAATTTAAEGVPFLFFVPAGRELVVAMSDADRPSVVILTGATPSCVIPSFCAALRERSRLRPRTYGPRSLMRTLTERPFLGF